MEWRIGRSWSFFSWLKSLFFCWLESMPKSFVVGCRTFWKSYLRRDCSCLSHELCYRYPLTLPTCNPFLLHSPMEALSTQCTPRSAKSRLCDTSMHHFGELK